MFAEGQPDRVSFSLEPRYKYKKIGEQIVFGDHVWLYNKAYDVYMHINQQEKLPRLDLPYLPADYRKEVPFRRPKPSLIYDHYEVTGSASIDKSTLKIVCFQMADRDRSTFFHGGGLYRIRHTETNMFISSDGHTRIGGTNFGVYLRRFKEQDDMYDRVSSHDLF